MSDGEIAEMLRELIEALDDAAHYKGEFLRQKHGDNELLHRARVLLAQLEAVLAQ